MAVLTSAALLTQPLEALAGPVLPEPLSVDINSQGYYQGIWGDKSRSFLTQGWFEQHNLTARYSKRTEQGIDINSQINAQATDDPLITAQRGKWQLLGGFFSAEKPQHFRIEGGNIVPQASRATLTASVLGVGGYYQSRVPKAPTRVTLIGGQIQPSVEGRQFQRGVAGVSVAQGVSGGLGSVKLQANAFRVEDMDGSIEHKLGLSRFASWVYSLNADIRSRLGLGLASEAAFTRSDNGQINGRSVWLSPSFRKGIFSAAANLEKNTPRFINPVGSISSDLEKADATLAVGKVHQITANALYTVNNVEGQLSATSKTRSLGATAKTVPFQHSDALKALSINGDYRLTRADGASHGQTQQAGLGLGWTSEGISASLRGEYVPFRDYNDTANNRDTYRGIWQMGLRLANEAGVTLNPYWNLSAERSRNLASNLKSRSQTASAGLIATYLDRFALGLRHDFQYRVSQPNERTLRNNATQVSTRFQLKTAAPIQLGLSYTYKDYRDSSLNRFGENELRGTVNVKF